MSTATANSSTGQIPNTATLARAIAEQLAKRFGHNPNVVGWQIDNEYASNSYDADTKAQFQAWLKARYGTLDNLNDRWTTSYWSQTYSNWNQIPIETTYGNPGLLLSWKRFVSDTTRSYQKNQLDVIRANADHQFITTNMMGLFDGYDHYTVSQDLDLVPHGTTTSELVSLILIKMASPTILPAASYAKNFWVMETQPGSVNWSANNNALDKGEVRAMAWHDIGHGADAVSYWQWRSALNGQEEYHGTLVGSDGTPVPLYTEVAQLGQEFVKASPVLAGTSVRSEVAILHSYDSRWAINWQRHNKEYDPVAELYSYYKPLRDIAQSIDIVNPSVSLSQYKLVVAPGLNVLSEEEGKNLIAYVEQGGNLVLGQRTGMKDIDNGLQVNRQPGPLVPLLGGRVEQYYSLTAPVPVSGTWGDSSSQEWAELLSASSPDTKVLMTYGKSNGWLDGQPAAITRKVGKGSITYIGAWLDEPAMKNAAKWMAGMSGVTAKLGPVPAGVDVYPREGDHGKVFILVNFAKTPSKVTLPTSMTDVLKGGTTRSVDLPVYGVAILSESR